MARLARDGIGVADGQVALRLLGTRCDDGKDAAMKRIEYRVEQMPFQEHPEKHISELVERLTELGQQGWRAVSVDLTFHPSYSPAAQPGIPLPVLLEREVDA